MQAVGIVPAAGYATRLQPLLGSKELVEVHGRPVIEFLLDRLEFGECSEIRVITRPDKEDLARHVAAHGAKVVLAQPRSVSESILAGLGDLADDDIVLVGFPDTVWEPLDGFALLRSKLSEGVEVVLGLFRVERDADCDRVDLDASGALIAVHARPHTTTSDLTWGCFAARVGALRDLSEPEPASYFEGLRTRDRLAAVVLSDRYFDIGTPSGLARVRALEPSDWRPRSRLDRPETRPP